MNKREIRITGNVQENQGRLDIKKGLFLTGILITAFGSASMTVEIHGCFMAPLSAFSYWWGQIPSDILGFLPGIAKYIIGVGLIITLISLIPYAIYKESPIDKLKFKYPQLKPFQKRRIYVHGFLYALVTVHITCTILGLTNMKSICPRSWCELMMKGQYGTSAIFWTIIFASVFVWGRSLCGWCCIFAPLQEQSTHLLKAFGDNPEKRKFRPTPFLPIVTYLMIAKMFVGNYRNYGHITYGANIGYRLDGYWVFWGGLLTFMPLIIFFTHYLGNRWFCKYACPFGGLQGLYSRLSLIKVRIDKDKCINCNSCARKCQMAVNISEHIEGAGNFISDVKCISCGDCIDACPKKALNFGFIFSKSKEKRDSLVPIFEPEFEHGVPVSEIGSAGLSYNKKGLSSEKVLQDLAGKDALSSDSLDKARKRNSSAKSDKVLIQKWPMKFVQRKKQEHKKDKGKSLDKKSGIVSN